MIIIANGVRLHYEQSGDGPPVVCLHGHGLNSGVWRNRVPARSRRFQTITVVENASHTVPEGQTDEFNRLTLDFLRATLGIDRHTLRSTDDRQLREAGT